MSSWPPRDVPYFRSHGTHTLVGHRRHVCVFQNTSGRLGWSVGDHKHNMEQKEGHGGDSIDLTLSQDIGGTIYKKIYRYVCEVTLNKKNSN